VTELAGSGRAPLGVAVVGTGNAGRQHLAAIAGLENVHCVLTVDTDTAAARATGLPVGTFADALADNDVHLVAVCTPPGMRVDLVKAAFRAGKHVLVEKPPAHGAAELESLLSAAADADRQAAVMFQHRFTLPEVLRTAAPQRFAGAAATLVVSRQRHESHYRAAGWRSQPSLALGGITAHLGVHYLDLACQLLGTPVAVTPTSRADTAEGIDLQLSGYVEFESGAGLTVMVTSFSEARVEHLAVLGKRDWIEIRDGVVTGVLDGGPVDTPARKAARLRAEVYRDLADSILSGRPVGLCALERGRGVITVLDGLLGRTSTGALGVA
jgi:UDP-N-acetyl-2-amino-2-deoxyglucuronate dehydrogenase